MTRLAIVVALVLAVAGGFAWGLASERWRVFPYSLLAGARGALRGEDPYRAARAGFFAEHPARAQVAMLGDSITDAGEWQELLPGIPVVNRGIANDTVRDLLARLEPVIATGASTVFVLAGFNDLMRGRDADAVADDYLRLVERLRAARVQVVVQSTLWCREGPIVDASAVDTMNRRVDRLDERLAAASAAGGFRYVDLNAVLGEAHRLRAEYTLDGVHLNAQGYLAWARQVRAELARR